MSDLKNTATLSKGRAGWCVIFRHPVARTPDGKQKLRVRRGLGTRDDAEAKELVNQLNSILSEPSYWSLAAKSQAEASYSQKVVAAFYDYLEPDRLDGWAERERELPLPSAEGGYVKVQFVGTTGAGKTTVVRQFLGTDPLTERFPSTSAAKTTIADIEIIMAEGGFKAAVSFVPRDQVRQYLIECVVAAVTAHLEGNAPPEVARRFMEHGEQRFRLSYILGALNPPSNEGELSDEEEENSDEGAEDAEVTDIERKTNAARLRSFLDEIVDLAEASRGDFDKSARDFGIDLSKASKQDRDALQELVEESLLQKEDFHTIVDAVLDEVEGRFECATEGEIRKGHDGWPQTWTYQTDSSNRADFLRAVNRFSSNYAPNFGRLLTPVVEGIRVSGPFRPQWASTSEIPKLVLMDAQGIGHTADSTSSISTGITRRFQTADTIVLVDNAAQPMQAAPVAALSTLVSSGHERKLVVAFTHFDEVKGDNLIGTNAKKDHVIGSFYNATQAIGKQSGREAEQSLRRLIPGRLAFLAKIQEPLASGARLTKDEFGRLLQTFMNSIIPPPPPEYRPVYDVANLVLAMQRATQEFHERWKGLLGMGSRSGVAPENWTRIKALTRRLGVLQMDEYDSLKPVADLIRLLQAHISAFLSEPLKWNPPNPPESKEAEMSQAIDAIRQEVFRRLHDLASKRVHQERISAWAAAYDRRGTGSTRIRARDIIGLYESAAPVPNEMPGPDTNEFLFELRELVAESVSLNKGTLLGWSREPGGSL